MGDQRGENFEDLPLTGKNYDEAVNAASARTLTDEQFSYMCSLDAEGVKSYLGREGVDYQERLVTVLKGSFDRAMDKTQTEAGQKLFQVTQSLIRQTSFSQETLKEWADVLYYMHNRVSGVQEGKRSKAIAEDMLAKSSAEYENRHDAYKENRDIKRDVARRNENVAKMAAKGLVKPLPGINAEQMARIAGLGHMLQGAGATTSEHVDSVKKVDGKAPQRGGTSRS